MSTILEIIQRVDACKPNAFTQVQKAAWIAALDGRIAVDVFLMDISETATLRYDRMDTLEIEPLVAFPHDDIYDLWLQAKIDFANGEYNKYQNTMALYNECYGNFVRWFSSVYEPAQGSNCERYCLRGDVPVYYISAYGLAVKQGYRGSLDEWLASLVGAPGAGVEMRYEGNALQWRREGDEVWVDVMNLADLQGIVVAQTLETAKNAAESAVAAHDAITNMQVSAHTLAAGSKATAEKSEADGIVHIAFGLPRGEAGAQGPVGPAGPQGVQGPEGPRGIAGVAVQTQGYVTFQVTEDGMLQCTYTGDGAPDYAINDAGHLILNF